MTRRLITIRAGRPAAALWLIAAAAAGAAFCGQSPPTPWRTGADFQERLRTETGVSWKGGPLRASLADLSRSQRIALLLDRRVDPDQLVDFTADHATLDNVLRSLARQLGIGVAYVDSAVVYLGPAPTAARLPTLAALRNDQLAKASAAAGRPLNPTRPCRWEMLATPRDLVRRLAEEAGAPLLGAERIPHDLWPAADLPPMTLAERLTLVLAGFDLSFQWSPADSGFRVIPMPAAVTIQRSYPWRGPADRLSKLASRFPDAVLRLAGDRLLVDGRWEDQQEIARILRGRRPAPIPPASGQKAYTLQVKNIPAGAVLKTIAAQTSLDVQVDPRAAERLQRRVTFQVQEVPLDQLLRQTLAPAGLAFRRRGKTLEVLPAP